MRGIVTAPTNKRVQTQSHRRGVYLVAGAICLAGIMAFMAFTVDLGLASLTKSQMQSAVDAAALAAAAQMTITLQANSSNVANAFALAQAAAQTKASYVAGLNNVYVDPSVDVVFGQRSYNSATSSYTINWSASAAQTNVIQVSARRTSTTKNTPTSMVPTLFAGTFGTSGMAVQASAIAYINPRDLVIVQDFSRSMNFDSYFTNEVTTGLTQAQIESALAMVWSDIQPLTLGNLVYTPQYFSQSQSSSGVTGTVTFKGPSVSVTSTTGLKSVALNFSSGGSQTINISGTTTKSGTYAGTSNNASKSISSVTLTSYQVGSTSKTVTLPTHSYNATNVMAAFGLTNGNYPYAGGSWSDYINYVQTSTCLPTYGYNDMYGGETYLCYIMKNYPEHSNNCDLWKTRHYPFQACKDGQSMLCDYLTSLGFDDHLGMVSYDTSHRIETTINDSNPAFPKIDLSATPMSTNYAAVKQLMLYKQAAYYSDSTNMAGGMASAIQMLQTYARPGASPQIILMTDGVANTLDSGVSGSLPSGWNWNTLFDYNGDGVADYSTTSTYAIAVLTNVQTAVNLGYKVHSVSVGSVADRNLMAAVAWMGKGYYLDVPAGTTIAQMSTQMQNAFALIAADVPPARLVNNGN